MLVLSLHSPTMHQQHLLADRGVLLRHREGVWSSAPRPGNGLRGPWVELVPKHGGVALRTSEGLLVSDKSEPGHLPFYFQCEATHFEVIATPVPVDTIPWETIARHDAAAACSADHAQGPEAATLSRWFEALSTLNRWEVGTEGFFRAAVDLVVHPIGFDGAYLVRRDTQRRTWSIVAASLPHPEQGLWLDTSMLDRLLDHPEVHFQGKSLSDGCGSVYAMAPWCDGQGEVAGAIVGRRSVHSGNGRRGVRHLEARLLGLLAESLTAEQTRHDQRQRCERRRKLLDQVFTPSLAERIEQQPEVLDGCLRKVTLLFADLRDSSRLFRSGQPTPVDTFRLLSDVMDALTSAVLEQQGVVVDYYGDGLSAMWNAPFDQPDHAERACRAAQAMVDRLHELSERWEGGLGLRLGVGIDSGKAQVGNIGSRWKLKYGARGEVVNRTSRLEEVTKTVGVPIVVSSEVARQLPADLPTCRLSRTRLDGIEGPVELFRLGKADDRFNSQQYAEALKLYEQGEFDQAATLIDQALRKAHAERAPFTFLAGKVEQSVRTRPGRRRDDLPFDSADLTPLS